MTSSFSKLVRSQQLKRAVGFGGLALAAASFGLVDVKPSHANTVIRTDAGGFQAPLNAGSFEVRNSAIGINRLRITQSGDVFIGSTVPTIGTDLVDVSANREVKIRAANGLGNTKVVTESDIFSNAGGNSELGLNAKSSSTNGDTTAALVSINNNAIATGNVIAEVAASSISPNTNPKVQIIAEGNNNSEVLIKTQTATGNGGDINVEAAGEIGLTTSGTNNSIRLETNGAGTANNIDLDANGEINLRASEGGIFIETFNTNNPIRLDANGDVDIVGRVSGAAPGNVNIQGDGNISLDAPEVVLGASDGSSTLTVPGLALAGAGTGFVTADANGVLSRTPFNVNGVLSDISNLQNDVSKLDKRTSRLESAVRDIDNAVESVGAMALAVSSIPNLTSGDKKYGCGLGTGVFGSSWAGAAGCVAKVSDEVWINAAITYAPGVSNSLYSTSSVGGRLGAFWQF
jgi:hypothetical protein